MYQWSRKGTLNPGCVDYPPADDIAGVFVAFGFIVGDLGTTRDNDVAVVYVGWLGCVIVVESRIGVLDDLELFSHVRSMERNIRDALGYVLHSLTKN